MPATKHKKCTNGCDTLAYKNGKCRKCLSAETPKEPRPPNTASKKMVPVDAVPEGWREETIHCDAITKNHRFQNRVAMSKETIKEYQEFDKEGQKLPPCKIVFTGTENLLCDGWHTYLALVNNGKTEIPCLVRDGDEIEALKEAAGANPHHGLKRKPEDIRKAVNSLLEENVRGNHGWTQEQIAGWARVSQSMVSYIAQQDSSPVITNLVNGRAEGAPPRARKPGRPSNMSRQGQMKFDWDSFQLAWGRVVRLPDDIGRTFKDEKGTPEFHAFQRLCAELHTLWKGWKKKVESKK